MNEVLYWREGQMTDGEELNKFKGRTEATTPPSPVMWGRNMTRSRSGGGNFRRFAEIMRR